MDQKEDIHIVGAGISGLIAAQVLEQNGYKPTIWEGSGSIGGRVKTDIIKDYQLDHGFQVMLDAYPKCKKYLDYETLELQSLLPGAMIFNNGRSQTIGDPLRNTSFLFSTLFSSVGSLGDKLKILSLNSDLKKKSIETIFESPELTTLHYLQKFGFSEKIIKNFFQPFFTGIFLETELTTPSRMFEFVYKMFGEGLAVIPKKGMGAVSDQLASKLKQTTINLNTKIASVSGNTITLEKGEQLRPDFIIVAAEPTGIIPNYQSTISWKRCDNLYFEVKKPTISKPIIGLNTSTTSLVNNIFYHTSVSTATKGAYALLSATVACDHELDEAELIKQVSEDLSRSFNIETKSFLKHYPIEQSLPHLSDLKMDVAPTESLLTDKIVLAGDYLLNGSLNATMASGENAAMAAIGALQNTNA